MDNFTLFGDNNDALLLFYNINTPICILLNLLAIYLIVFKSSREMGEYRWYLLYYQASDFRILCPGQSSNICISEFHLEKVVDSSSPNWDSQVPRVLSVLV
uniref:Ovule protein n=1 Tax=Heterorhabditis bacteriophora TaxID=37862 RepID=A0A1I7X9K7_HETBA